jgi:hypothetical protein
MTLPRAGCISLVAAFAQRALPSARLNAQTRLISATDAAATIERALESGDEAAAIRHLTEAVSRLIHSPEHTEIPRIVLIASDPIKDAQYATLIATAFAYAMLARGEKPLAWMTDAKPLATEWLWDGEGSSGAFRDLIRRNTPDIFRAKDISHARARLDLALSGGRRHSSVADLTTCWA